MVSYADTSFLIPLYVSEPASQGARELAARLKEPLPIHSLLLVEFRNALNLGLKFGKLAVFDRDRIWGMLEADVANGVFVRTTFSMQEIYPCARDLSDRCSPRLGTRSLDLLQIASAVTLGAREILTYDRRQAEAAKLAGLQVRP